MIPKPTPVRRERSLRIALTDQQADELFTLLHELAGALWDAYEDVLLASYFEEQRQRQLDEEIASAIDRELCLEGFSDEPPF